MDPVVETAAVATEAPASRLADDPKVVDAVQAHLDAFNDVIVEAPETPEVEAAPAAEEQPAEEAAAAPEPKPAEEPKPVEAAAAPVASTLPAAYVRTAKARGWTDQEIADAVKVNPDAAMRTFERMHTSRTQEIQEWAELGRKVRQGSASPVSPSPAPVHTAPATAATPSAPAGLQPINVPEMVAKYGNEELITALAGPVNAAITALQPIMAEAQAARDRNLAETRNTLGKTVQDFFTDKSMAPYADAYGKDLAALTPAQIETRSRVLETADALIAGARFQGRNLSVQDALTLAHDSVSSGMKEGIIRDQIRTNVQKRAKGVTLKPTAQGRQATGAPPRDRAELVGRTQERLASVFG
jgi:hypothetical protein